MNNLEKIQKTMKVFQTLTKIVMDCFYISGWQRKFDGR